MSLFTAADVAAFKADRLMAAAAALFPDVCLSDDYLLGQLYAAEASISHSLKVFLEPTTIFPYEPTEDEITALAGKAWAEEPGYDFDPDFFAGDSWGYIVTRARPIISVEYVRLVYPSQQTPMFAIPADWLRIDKKYGQIRTVPASSSVTTAPLSVFALQALGGGRTIPSVIHVKYVAGIKDAKTDPRWADLLDVIMKQAVLNVIDGTYLPQSGSISADGLSQSTSLDTAKYGELIDRKLFGPKGSNGGLWTAIHGIGNTVAGVSA